MRAYRPEGIDELHGIPPERIAEWSGVHVTTARRWKRGEEPPLSALKIIRLMSTGNLGEISPAWQGWQLMGGKLYGPDGAEFTRSEILAGPFWRRLAKEYQEEQKVERQADWVSERWVDASVEQKVGTRA